MESKRDMMKESDFKLKTFLARSRVKKTLELAKQLEADSDSTKRVQQQKCKSCHYFPRIAGQAFTSKPCACCGEVQTFSSTATDAFCQPCATKHDLCKTCGGDREMRDDRKDWPRLVHQCL